MAMSLLPDTLWNLIEPLLPTQTPKPQGGRPRLSDRACLQGVLFVLRSGIPWRMLPQEMNCGSGMSCWRRLRDWQDWLARNGFTIAIFEASSKLGGCCATTTLDGYTFNDGAVYLAVINILDHAFQKVGLNRAELLPLRKISASYSATLPDSAVVTLGEGLDLTVTGRSVDPNRLQGELRRMMDKWQPVLRFVSEELALHPFSSWRMLRKGWRHLHKLHGTVASELNLFTSFTGPWLPN